MRFFIFEQDADRIVELTKLLTVASSGNKFHLSRSAFRLLKDFDPVREQFNYLILDTDKLFKHEQNDLLKFTEEMPELEKTPPEGWAEALVIGSDQPFISSLVENLEKKFYLTSWKAWGVDLFIHLEEELKKAHILKGESIMDQT